MTKKKIDSEKSAELNKFRALVLACLDYHLENPLLKIKTAEFDSDAYYEDLKIMTEENFQKGRLTRLKQWFRDLTEMEIESGNILFNTYLQNKTGYDIDIFEASYKRVEKIIAKGKITTDHQFYEINEMVNQLCQAQPVHELKIDALNKLLSDYEVRKTKK